MSRGSPTRYDSLPTTERYLIWWVNRWAVNAHRRQHDGDRVDHRGVAEEERTDHRRRHRAGTAGERPTTSRVRLVAAGLRRRDRRPVRDVHRARPRRGEWRDGWPSDVTIGRWQHVGAGDDKSERWTEAKARKRAQLKLGQMGAGMDPVSRDRGARQRTVAEGRPRDPPRQHAQGWRQGQAREWRGDAVQRALNRERRDRGREAPRDMARPTAHRADRPRADQTRRGSGSARARRAAPAP